MSSTCLAETSLVGGEFWESEAPKQVLAAIKDKELPKEFYTFLEYDGHFTDVSPIVFNHPHWPSIHREKMEAFDRGIREHIYNVSRSANRSGDAIAVFEAYFSKLPDDQPLSIQLGDGEPFVVKVSSARVLETKFFQPKHMILSTTMEIEDGVANVIDYGVGQTEGASHYLLMFHIPGAVKDPKNPSKSIAVVDMTSMQFGDVGRGAWNELFIMDTLSGWVGSVAMPDRSRRVASPRRFLPNPKLACSQIGLPMRPGRLSKRRMSDVVIVASVKVARSTSSCASCVLIRATSTVTGTAPTSSIYTRLGALSLVLIRERVSIWAKELTRQRQLTRQRLLARATRERVESASDRYWFCLFVSGWLIQSAWFCHLQP